jgi:dTMP kinase
MYLDSWSGVFITLEGGEGSGKTSVATFLKEQLEAAGVQVLLVREPGSTKLGDRVREILLERKGLTFGAMSELLLYLAARAQNIEENILPALKSKQVVLCDRYNDSSMAYQAAARGLESKLVSQLCHLVTAKCQPHLTLWLDVDPATGCERARRHKDGGDVLDRESLEFHERVRQAYVGLAVEHSKRIVRVDATQTLEQVQEECKQFLFAFLHNHRDHEGLIWKGISSKGTADERTPQA